MKIFYHVSRGDISNLSELDLKKTDFCISSEGIHSCEEFIKYKTELFPSGISRHGQFYLDKVFLSTGPNLSHTPNELILETTFDLVRQLKFPDIPSRFTSVFGCLTLEDALIIKSQTFQNQGVIYRVACENYFIADMNLLRQVATVIGLQLVAEKYWSGQSSNNPFLEVLMACPVIILEAVG